jgi:hypothetical protein
MRNALVFIVVLTGCYSSGATRTGPEAPPKPGNCEVKIFRSANPDYPIEDLGTAHETGCPSLAKCEERMRKHACALGGDTIYMVTEGTRTGGAYRMHASVARRVEAPPPASAPPVPTCDPACAIGFECRGGVCVSQCDPPCAAGTHCESDRACHADAPAP